MLSGHSLVKILIGLPGRFSLTWEYIWLSYKFMDDIRVTSETGKVELWSHSSQFCSANFAKLYILIK